MLLTLGLQGASEPLWPLLGSLHEPLPDWGGALARKGWGRLQAPVCEILCQRAGTQDNRHLLDFNIV